MNKKILFKEIQREIVKINNNIDTKIIKGRSYEREAKRHRDLLVSLQRIRNESQIKIQKKRSRMGRSPVRRSFKKGVVARLFSLNFT